MTSWNVFFESGACGGGSGGDPGPGNDGCYWPAAIEDPECKNRRYLSTTEVTGEYVDPGMVWTLRFSTGGVGDWPGNAMSRSSRVRCIRTP